jgi:hypothetical protein
VTPPSDKVTKLREQIDAGKSDFQDVDDVHVLAAVVKMFFRDLPDPIMTYELYDAFSQVSGIRHSSS